MGFFYFVIIAIVMKKNVSANILRRLYSSLAVCALLTAIVIGMLLHAQALSLRIAVLENESALMTTKLNS